MCDTIEMPDGTIILKSKKTIAWMGVEKLPSVCWTDFIEEQKGEDVDK